MRCVWAGEREGRAGGGMVGFWESGITYDDDDDADADAEFKRLTRTVVSFSPR